MKTKSISNKWSRGIKPGSLSAVVTVCGFWASLALALYYVSGVALGIESALVGLLYFALFALFFLLHSFGPGSKYAALLGLSSLVVLVAFFRSLSSPFYLPLPPSVLWAILLSAALSFVGILMDAGKYVRWAARMHDHSLNLKDAVQLAFRRTIRPKNYDYTI